jgi:hypothetical protein
MRSGGHPPGLDDQVMNRNRAHLANLPGSALAVFDAEAVEVTDPPSASLGSRWSTWTKVSFIFGVFIHD